MINVWNHIVVLGFAIAAFVIAIMAFRVSIMPLLSFFTGEMPEPMRDEENIAVKLNAHDFDEDN